MNHEYVNDPVQNINAYEYSKTHDKFFEIKFKILSINFKVNWNSNIYQLKFENV